MCSLWTTRAPKDPAAVPAENVKTVKDESNNDVTLYKVADKLTSDDQGHFGYKIGVGTYYLYEDKAPDGFNLMTDPIVFTVSANIEENQLKGLSVDNAALAANENNGIISTTILNNTGTTMPLPGTGGAGTKAFMLGGGFLMIGSVAGMLLSGRRKSRKSVNQ